MVVRSWLATTWRRWNTFYCYCSTIGTRGRCAYSHYQRSQLYAQSGGVCLSTAPFVAASQPLQPVYDVAFAALHNSARRFLLRLAVIHFYSILVANCKYGLWSFAQTGNRRLPHSGVRAVALHHLADYPADITAVGVHLPDCLCQILQGKERVRPNCLSRRKAPPLKFLQ